MTAMKATGAAALLLAACTISDDPADGGFASGVAGLSSGTYQDRVDQKQATADAETARQADLQAQLGALQGEYQRARLELAQARSRVAASGAAIPAGVDREVTAALRAPDPGGATDSERLSRLRDAIAKARSLSAELADINA